ncbi:MAG: chemotaxis protein CheW [Deltaproteobacteria bacterium]|nr:chemotaxis protein CheW [Deltaproteobacteria bacterium]
MSICDDETLRLYIEESLEHLADIENDLLAIEADGEDIDEDLVNKVFRAAHSIKGGAGFMGLDNIKELSHKMESVLGMIREKEMRPNPEIVNILLLASDCLKNLINNVDNSNDIDISGHVKALISLADSYKPGLKTNEDPLIREIRFPLREVTFSVSMNTLSVMRKKGNYIYMAEYDLISDVQDKGSNPAELTSKLGESGSILDCRIDFETVGTLENDDAIKVVPFLILFATVLEPGLINVMLGIDESRIFLVSEDPNCICVKDLSENGEDVIKSNEPDLKEEDFGDERSDNPTFMETAFSSSAKMEEPARSGKASPGSGTDTSLRVHVSLLDDLMNLAGELVLGRNQLVQAITLKEFHNIEASGQDIDLITSELQEAIMMTRMQPIGNILNKFPRVVRDLARSLGKEVNLTIKGEGVELDKTILEAINDPLTHLVRNAVDHGLERPDERLRAGKNATGQVLLKAYHEAGQVNIEISDDGRGMDGHKLVNAAIEKNLLSRRQASTMSDKEKINLVFLPGFSTAEAVSDVSGRGVGMDVVKTNLDKLGGLVDIDSTPGKGTNIRIKLPLTLAIIPSQIIKAGGERYAIPQVNLEELFRIPAAQVKERIERVGDAEVVRLRGNLLPLIRLSDVIGLERIYVDPLTNEARKDRRENIADRRSLKSPLFEDSVCQHGTDLPDVKRHASLDALQAGNKFEFQERGPDRRYRAQSSINIVVVYTGALKYGLIVDELNDSEEIVVKPLGSHLKHCKGYAGATIMGDGRVALILDVAGLSQMARLTSMEGTDRAMKISKEHLTKGRKDVHSMLIFRNAEDEQFAVPLGLVERIEKIKRSDIENVGGMKIIQYRNESLPLFAIEEVAKVKPLAERDDLLVVVFRVAGMEIGLLATPPLDAIEESISIDDTTLKQKGIMGSAIIRNLTTLIVDIFGIVETLNPDWFSSRKAVKSPDGISATILYAEDSNFFRNQVKEYMVNDGYNVIEAEDGVTAFELLEEHRDKISLIVTDIEMPNMNGFELAKKIRGDERFSGLPIIALTTMASDEDMVRGKETGIDDYLIKLDKENLLQSIFSLLEAKRR